MKLAAPLSIVLACSSIFLAAQNLNQLQAQAAMQPAYSGCPISLRAQHSVGGDLLNASSSVNSSRREGNGQRLYLTIADLQNRQIAAATVIVHGPTSVGQVELSLSNRQNSSNAAKTVAARFSAGSDDTASAHISVPDLTAVQSIDLKSVTYADGSSWKPSPGETCHFIPDVWMLIATR